MRFLAIDASTTRSGWAVFSDEGLLINSGSFTGGGGVRGHRLRNMGESLAAVAADFKVGRIVMEWPSGKAATHGRRSHAASRDAYTIGVGWLAGFLSAKTGLPIVEVPADKWTRSRPKKARLRDLELRGYEFANEDEGDAIDLGLWYAEQEHQRSLESRIVRGEKRPGGEAVVEIRELTEGAAK